MEHGTSDWILKELGFSISGFGRVSLPGSLDEQGIGTPPAEINIGHTFGNMLWPHALSEETQTNWNGINGKVEQISLHAVWIEEVQAYPDCEKKVTRIRVVIDNLTGGSVKGTIDLSLLPDGQSISDHPEGGI